MTQQLPDQHDPAALIAPWRFDSSWQAFAGLQGGLVLGTMASNAHRLASAAAGEGYSTAVRTAQVHYLRPVATDADFAVHAWPTPPGRTISTHLEVHQGDRVSAVGQVLTGAVRDHARSATRPAPDHTAQLPDAPDHGDPLVLPVDFVPVSQHVELRAVGPGRPMAAGPEPRLSAWMRTRDSAAITDAHLALGLLVDVMPPSLFAITDRPQVLPTVELTLHLHRPPPPPGGWLRMEQWTDLVDAYGCIDEAVLHDESGQLVARSRQTRRIRPT